MGVSRGGAASGILFLFQPMLEGGVEAGETSGSALHRGQTNIISVRLYRPLPWQLAIGKQMDKLVNCRYCPS